MMKINIKERLQEKKKQLNEIIVVENNGIFKNSQNEILMIKNQLIGEIQILSQMSKLK